MEELAKIIEEEYKKEKGEGASYLLILRILVEIVKILLQYALENNMSLEDLVKKTKNMNFIERGYIKNQCKNLIADIDGEKSLDSSALTELIFNQFTALDDAKAIEILEKENFRLV